MAGRLTLSFAWLAALAGCAVDGEVARAAWLQDTLVRDNQVFLDREPELAGGKLAKMAARPYDYFRGSASQFGRDFSETGSPGHWPTRYLDRDTWDVALVGDPHPENIGTFLGRDALVRVEFNDFDAAIHGPWVSDVRRLALGFALACRQVRASQAADAIEAIAQADCAAWSSAVVEGYVAAIPALADDPEAGITLREGESQGLIVDDMLARAREDGDAGTRLADYTLVEAGGRSMVYAELEPPVVMTFGAFEIEVHSDTVLEPTPAERELVEAVLREYPASLEQPIALEQFELLGLSRRLGSGVSSYPVPRFYLLLAGPSESPDDDVLLEAKQVLDPILLPDTPRLPRPGWPDNASRVVAMQRELQSAGTDRWLGGVQVGGFAAKLRHYSGYQLGFSVDRLVAKLGEGKWTSADMQVFADQAGRLLALAHARASKADGRRGGPAIARVLEPDPAGFVRETNEFVASYAERTELDHALLVDLLETRGPTLGYRAQGANE